MSDACFDEGQLTWLLANPDINRLYDNVQVMCPGVTFEVVRMIAWNTLEDFYQRSTLNRKHVFWEMQPGQSVLNFDPFDKDWRVFQFIEFEGLSHPQFESPGTLRDLTSPAPDTLRKGQVVLGLKPNSIETKFPYELWSLYFEALLAGVVGRLYMMSGKPFSDPNMARVRLKEYSVGVGQARASVQSGGLTDGVMWRFPYFALGRPKSGGWGV